MVQARERRPSRPRVRLHARALALRQELEEGFRGGGLPEQRPSNTGRFGATNGAKDGTLMANAETNSTDLARAEILWKSADALRGQIDAAEYKHVVLGLLFLKYISDSFEARRDELKAELAADGITGPQLESLL